MKADRFLLLALLAAFAVVALLCSCAQLAGGDVTETGNARISGRIVDTQGSGIQNVRVMLLPVNYNPVTDPAIPDSMLGTTDEAGFYTVKAPGRGSFSVEALDVIANNKTLITGITIENNGPVNVRESVLHRPGVLRVVLQDTANEATGYVYLPGTTCHAHVRTGIAMVDAVPAGFIPAVYYANTAVPARDHVIQTLLTVTSNDTQVIADTVPWSHSKTLYLNTTAAGAGVGQDVYDFPALVRLTSTNFDFSQAKSGGEDVRFAKADGSPLSYEIERWDTAARQAEIWVKVDTVYGNDSTQSLMMYWGNGNAAAQSNGASVFDTGSGFQAVWHLGEAGNAVAKDATVNHYDGTPSDTAPAGAAGTIGPCRSFNGSSNYIRMNGTADSKLNFPENGTYTVSAWVNADTIDYGSHLIIGKSSMQYFLKFKFSLPNDPMVWEFVECHDKAGFFITNTLPVLPKANTWTYITGVRNGTSQYFYLNGELVDSTISVSYPSSSISRQTGSDVTIGRFLSKAVDTTEGMCPFMGKIDEVRISNAACSADWIKLCYMNQKNQDALVKW